MTLEGGDLGAVLSSTDDPVISGGDPGKVVTDRVDGNGKTSDTIDGNLPVDGVGGEVFPPAPVVFESRQLWLESMDGSVRIDLNVDVDQILTGGVTGLGLPPVEVKTVSTPGMPGSSLQEINQLEREVFLPLNFGSEKGHADFLGKMGALLDLVSQWDDVEIGQLGTFRLVANSLNGERLLAVTYKSGLEGEWGKGTGGSRWQKLPLTVVAVDPFWRDRNPTVRTYQAPAGRPFLGDGSGNAPWPRRLSASVVIGEGMEVVVNGDVPVWPEIDLIGPASSASLAYKGTSVLMPSGVADDGLLALKTDPRTRSVRLNGAIAWSRVSMGSTFTPLRPGLNIVDVVLATSSNDTALVLRWFNGYKTAFT